MNFSPQDLAVWFLILAAVIAGLNQGIDLFRKLTDAKADKPATPEESLVTAQALDKALATIHRQIADFDIHLRHGSELFATKQDLSAVVIRQEQFEIGARREMNDRLSGLSTKVESVRASLSLAIAESVRAGEERVDRLNERLSRVAEDIKEKVGELRGQVKT